MDLHQQNAALYERELKSVRIPFKLNIASGIMKSDLGSAMATATETQDDISSDLGETLSPSPSDTNGIVYFALKASEAGELDRYVNAEVLSAAAAFGTVSIAAASVTSNGNLLVQLDSDQDITGDDGELELMIEYLRK